jgi:5-methylcytosine-specific restriction enzyme A
VKEIQRVTAMGRYSSDTRLYNNRRWRLKHTQQLQQQPLCVMCLANGRVTAATIADHIQPHNGDLNLFWHGELQSLCTFHHNKTKQRIERKGSKVIDVEYSSACDVNGRPIDPNHPSNTFK